MGRGCLRRVSIWSGGALFKMACICWHLQSSISALFFFCPSRLWRVSLSPANCTSGSISSLATSSRVQKQPGRSTFSITWPTKGRLTWAPSTTPCSERYQHDSVTLAKLGKTLLPVWLQCWLCWQVERCSSSFWIVDHHYKANHFLPVTDGGACSARSGKDLATMPRAIVERKGRRKKQKRHVSAKLTVCRRCSAERSHFLQSTPPSVSF